jgi:hypothetical protein
MSSLTPTGKPDLIGLPADGRIDGRHRLARTRLADAQGAEDNGRRNDT